MCRCDVQLQGCARASTRFRLRVIDRTQIAMKFGKLLKLWAAEELPGNSDLVLRFKALKKQLKLIKPAEELGKLLFVALTLQKSFSVLEV